VTPTVRLVAIGALLHIKQLSRNPLEIVISLFSPIVLATLAVYLFRAGDSPPPVIQAAIGAGMMGIWESVLFGSGGAVQDQRWSGTLELLVSAPRRLAMKFLPITVASAVFGAYAVLATILWCVVVFRVDLDIARPVPFVIAVAVTIASLGMMGLLLASTFVLLPNANALANTLSYPVWLLSGMLVAISTLPGWLDVIGAALPTTWGSRAVQEAAVGGPVWPALAICLAEGVACAALGSVLMDRMERRARAAATLALA
jgi:ABC-type multidrug transport system permease subunit